MEEVIRGSILLENDDDVLDLWRELSKDGACGKQEGDWSSLRMRLHADAQPQMA